MNLVRLSLAAVVASALAVGCANDPNKKVESAEADLASERERANAEQAELSRKQMEERADNSNAGWEERAEMDRRHESDQAETTADSQQNISGARNDVVAARSDMAQDRRDFDSTVQERLSKADAKAKELKTKSVKLDGKKSVEFNANLKHFSQARNEAEAKARSLKESDGASWSSVKSDVEKRLDLMESTLDKMGKDL